MQMNKPTCSSSVSDYVNHQRQRVSDNFVDQSDATITLIFNQCLQLDQKNTCNSHHDQEEEEFLDCEDGEEDNHEGEGDDDFTFIHVGQNDSPISAEKASQNAQIQPVFPLFNQDLLSGEIRNQPPVDKVFVESSLRAPSSSTSEHGEIEGLAVGPYCTWSKHKSAKDQNPELRKKSNSTGFSKLWRLRGKVGRSNSDGRDAFVFLKSSDRSKSSSKSVKSNAAGSGKAKAVKKGTKAQKTNLSAHEVYLKKREQTEEERRRSYLPYRPEIMGFFTNVNGALSRNVHPY